MSKIDLIHSHIRAELDSVLDRFNAEKVHDIMEFMGWKWATSSYGVPEAWEIRSTARRLLSESYFSALANGGEGYCATGGIVARCTIYPVLDKDDTNSERTKTKDVTFDLTFAAVSAESWST